MLRFRVTDAQVEVGEVDVEAAIQTNASDASKEYLDLPASVTVDASIIDTSLPNEQTDAAVDPLASLRQQLAALAKQEAEAIARRDQYARTSPQFTDADKIARDAAQKKSAVDRQIREQEASLKPYFDAKRAMEEAREDTEALQCAHDSALQFLRTERAAERYNNAILAAGLLSEALEKIAAIEAQRALSLAKSRTIISSMTAVGMRHRSGWAWGVGLGAMCAVHIYQQRFRVACVANSALSCCTFANEFLFFETRCVTSGHDA